MATTEPAPAPAPPDVRLAAWEMRTRPYIIAAAVLPLFGVFMEGPADAVAWIVAFGTWLVFVVDLVVHVRLAPGYLRTRTGLFDLFLVVSTFPWYLVLGSDTAGVTQVLRLARLERIGKVVFEAPRVKRFVERLGRPVLYATVMWVTCSIIVTRSEGPEHGFTSLGAGLYWGIVTLTTVGYGDLVPTTAVGRFTAAILMVSGVALLGTVAASLASLFRTQDQEGVDDPMTATAKGIRRDVDELERQLAEMSADLRAVRQLLESRPDDAPPPS